MRALCYEPGSFGGAQGRSGKGGDVHRRFGEKVSSPGEQFDEALTRCSAGRFGWNDLR